VGRSIDRWQQNPARPVDPAAEAFAVLLRTFLCRHGAGQMRSDADAAAHRFTELGAMLPVIPLLQGLTRILAGDLFVWPHTIKTQVNSIYRKLGASTRSQAVAQARQLGLLDG
jgi:LuxR family maltose regulon positive regulatory protein